MSQRKSTAREPGEAFGVEPRSPLSVSLSRRGFMLAAAGALATPWLGSGIARADHHGAAASLPAPTLKALENSPFVYVSPLRSDGSESRCHGEVWYGWFEGSVFLTSASSTWKSRSVAAGLSKARIWVGDYGRWKRVLGRNDAFLEGPSFDAKVEVAKDPAQVSELLAQLARKYPDEFPSWKGRMEAGHKDGSRVLLRYTPIVA